jgi:hypothetical protein
LPFFDFQDNGRETQSSQVRLLVWELPMRIEIFWTIGLILTVTAIIVFSSYSTFNAQRETLKECFKKYTTPTPTDNYKTIRGWLYAWLLTASVISLKTVLGLIAVLPPFNHDLWAIANDPASYSYNSLLQPLLLIELIGRTTLLCIVSVMVIDFVNRRQYVPRLVIGFLVANLLFLMTEQLLLREIMGPLYQFLQSGWKPFRYLDLVLATISCLVWIPYFHSKRVKVIFSVHSHV